MIKSRAFLINDGTWSTEQMLGAHCQGLPHDAPVWNFTRKTMVMFMIVFCCCAADRSGGLWRGSVCPECYQELPDSHPWSRVSLSDPHHQRAGETADDCWWDVQLCHFQQMISAYWAAGLESRLLVQSAQEASASIRSCLTSIIEVLQLLFIVQIFERPFYHSDNTSETCSYDTFCYTGQHDDLEMHCLLVLERQLPCNVCLCVLQGTRERCVWWR